MLSKAMTVRQKDTKRDRETRTEEGHGRDGLNEDRIRVLDTGSLSLSLCSEAQGSHGSLWGRGLTKPPKLRKSEMSASVMGGV